MKAFFVTGTDTGVGKTTVACGLLAAARQAGLRAAACKPAESGCELVGGRLVPADAVALRAAAGGWQDLGQVCGYRYQAPVAPAVAARVEGREVDVGEIARVVSELREVADFTLVEGAGGLLVPLVGLVTMADLAAKLDLPILVVARDALGTINHTALTVEVARRRGLVVAGVVLSACADVATTAAQQNQREIQALLGDVPVLGCIPRLTTAAEVAAATQELNLRPLGLG